MVCEKCNGLRVKLDRMTTLAAELRRGRDHYAQSVTLAREGISGLRAVIATMSEELEVERGRVTALVAAAEQSEVITAKKEFQRWETK